VITNKNYHYQPVTLNQIEEAKQGEESKTNESFSRGPYPVNDLKTTRKRNTLK